MTRQIINVGTADKGNGDPIRTAFIKANANFAELYNILSNNTGGSIITTDVIGSVFADDSTLLVDGINGSIPYSVLSGAPTIPAAQVQSNWTASSGMGVILNKPTLFSGSYTDLTSKPTIPTLVSQLANDSGFLTSVSNISNIRSEGNINIDINLSDSTLRRWQFGEDGILTLPSVGKINNGAYDWTFGSTGITTFPGVINAGNINNLVVNDAGGGTSLTAGSQLQIGNSAGIAGAGVIIKNAVTNTLGGEISLESGSKIQMDNGNVSLFGYTYNSIDGIDSLEVRLGVEVDNSNLNKGVRIGTRIINTIEGSTTNVFQGITISQYGALTFPDNTVQSTAWTGFSVAADDSTQRLINAGELVKFIGAGGVTTASDAEGNITINYVQGDIRSEGNINIDINLSDSTLRRWQFGEDGNLTLPQGGNISEGGGISGAIKLTPAGGANAYQALMIYPTAGGEGDHIHLTAGGGTTELYLGNDTHYVKLGKGAGYNGTIVIAATGRPNTVSGIISSTGNWAVVPLSNLATTGGTGTGLTVTVTQVAGVATATAIVSGAMEGYTSGDTITVTSGAATATFIIGVLAPQWVFAPDGDLYIPSGNTIRKIGSGEDIRSIPGPYADDEAAALAGVALGSPYHKTGTGGQVFVRLTSPT